MGKPIKDEFADLPISRQDRYQLRMKRESATLSAANPP